MFCLNKIWFFYSSHDFTAVNDHNIFFGSTSSISITSGLSLEPMGGPFLGRVWPEICEIRSATLKPIQSLLHFHFEEQNHFYIFTFCEGQLDCVELRGDEEEHVIHLQHQKSESLW